MLYLVTLSLFLIFNSPRERVKLAKVTIMYHIENHIHLEERVNSGQKKKKNDSVATSNMPTYFDMQLQRQREKGRLKSSSLY